MPASKNRQPVAPARGMLSQPKAAVQPKAAAPAQAQRVSPGVYRMPSGQIVNSATKPPAQAAKPAVQPRKAAPIQRPLPAQPQQDPARMPVQALGQTGSGIGGFMRPSTGQQIDPGRMPQQNQWQGQIPDPTQYGQNPQAQAQQIAMQQYTRPQPMGNFGMPQGGVQARDQAAPYQNMMRRPQQTQVGMQDAMSQMNNAQFQSGPRRY